MTRTTKPDARGGLFPETGNVTVYRKHNKPALGPLGGSLEDFK